MKHNEANLSQIIAGLKWYGWVAFQIGHCTVKKDEIHAYLKTIQELIAENERLKNRITCSINITDEQVEEIKSDILERVELDIKAIQADTVRKMQARLKALLKTDYINGTKEHAISVIDRIVKEMIGGETK